jgi:hypothetical protein
MDRWSSGPQALESVLGLTEDLAGEVHRLVRGKLEREPVEDFRIDFEDGYGNRSDEEEDGHARSAAGEVAKGLSAGTLPPFVGIRIKPKIQDAEQVEILCEALAELEGSLGIGEIPIELMIETPQTVIDRDGSSGARRFVDAASGRVRGAHYGTYDYTASMSITAAYQTMTHPACDFARHSLQVSLAGTGVWLSDGATNVMPVPIHRGEALTPDQVAENEPSTRSSSRVSTRRESG